MPSSTVFALLGAALIGAWAVTGLVRRFALAAQLLDVPNERSSHTRATPRGGGLAIVATFALALAGLVLQGVASADLAITLLGPSLLVGGIGFFDDRRPLPARWRFLAHLAASGWILWRMGGIPAVPVFGVSIDLGWLGPAIAAVYLVWMVNLTNFMDGIDALASLEAISVALAGGLCWWLATATPLWFVPVLLASCVAGFLIWNYPPAKIFMGDAGSGFIGIVLGILSLWTAQEATQVFWSWFILLGVFMVDATTTLIRRVRRGEKFNEAHRSHAYQYAARKHGSHKTVTLACGLINIVWLLPLAVLVAMRKLDGAVGVIVAYGPLVWLAFHYKAGARADQGALS